MHSYVDLYSLNKCSKVHKEKNNHNPLVILKRAP